MPMFCGFTLGTRNDVHCDRHLENSTTSVSHSHSAPYSSDLWGGEAITEATTAPVSSVPAFVVGLTSFPAVPYLSCIFLVITPVPLCSIHIP